MAVLPGDGPAPDAHGPDEAGVSHAGIPLVTGMAGRP